MRLILVILILSSGTVHSRTYYEKRRFDRSVHDDSRTLIANNHIPNKQWTFIDDETYFKAYKDKEVNDCYLEKLEDVEELSEHRLQQRKRILYASTEALTKLEAWRIAGGRIVEFCQGRQIILLQSTMPILVQTVDPFSNVIPLDENDIVTRRVADVVLTPLISRAKRQIVLEERKKLNENFRQTRTRRQAQPPRGRFRGQTQSQYLNIGSNDQTEGKAEAEATQQSSRAIVSGSRGMGQAQSMSSSGSGCEDCPKYSSESPDRYIQHPGASAGTISGTGEIRPGTGGAYPNIFPTIDQTGGRIVHPGTIIPGRTYTNGQSPGGTVYPGAIPPGSTGEIVYPGRAPGTSTTGGGAVYSGSVPGTTTAGGGGYPGSVPSIQTPGGGTVYPGTTTTGGGTVYPGGVPGTITAGGGGYPGSVPSIQTPGGGTVYPGTTTTGGGTVYPGTTTTGGGAVYPGTTTTGGGTVYPGSVPGTTTTGGGTVYPGTTTTGGGAVYPGSVSGIQTPGGGVIYPGSVPGTTTTVGGTVYTGGVPGTTTTGGGAVYPGRIPGIQTPGGGAVYPGSVTGTTTTGGGAGHPGSVSGIQTPGGGAVYPGSVPSIQTPGGGAVYPGGVPGTTTTGGRVVYPGSVSGIQTPGSGTVYPGSVAGIQTPGGGVIYPGSVPGTTTTVGGTVYTGGVPGTTTTGGGAVYPGSVPGIQTPGGGVIYPVNVPGTTTTGGGAVYPGSVPGTTTTGGGTVYPGSVPGTTTTGGGRIITDSKATADTKIYPGQIPGGLYPGMVVTGPSPGGSPSTIAYPGGVTSPGAVIPGISSYPGSIVTGTPGQLVTSDRINYPGGIPTGVGGTGLYPSGTFSGANVPNIAVPPDAGIVSYPGVTQPKVNQVLYPPGVQTGSDNLQRIETGQSQVPYPNAVQKYPDGSVIQYPGVEKYPGSTGTVPSGYPSQQGHYPGTQGWPTGRGQSIPGMTGGISGQGTGQYPGQTIGQQYPGLQYPAGTGPAANIREPSQYYQQPVSVATTADDNSDSQASSSVKQTDAGTQASASAQGTHGQGTAQSQVSGTYTGSGSFSAQAGSSDNNKSAQTEVSGGKGGATSNSQGTGGYGKSQAQVQLDSESGATSTGAQSSGWNHGTNSQVQASSKGGMADAQANGEGSTSSQAQIGFQPYLKTNEKLERHSEPFRGGGTASAQSGTNRGQSQSQLEGSFQYGITYSGAAQAGSGSGAVASRKPFNFSRTDTEIFHSFKPYNTPQTGKDNRSDVTNVSVDEYNQDKSTQGLQTSPSSRKTIVTNVTTENSQNVGINQNQSAEKSQVDDTMYEYDEEYDGEDYDSTQMHASMNSKQSKATIVESNTNDHQSQTIQFTTGNRYDVRVNQDSNTPQTGDMLQPGQSLPGYTIPPGFRGRVTSVAGDVTIAHGDGKSQSQTVSLTPIEPNITRENKSPISEIRSLKTNHERLAEDRASFKDKHKKYNNHRVQSYLTSMEYSKPTTDVPIKQSYYTVTNSFAGKMDGSRNSPRKYEHRYYTKSSTCGYFTFSCNVVYGSNGRTKICKPKMPTHPDGTPMKC